MEIIYSVVVGYYIELVLVAMTGSMIYIFKYMRALNRGVKAILRNSIIHVYNTSIERGTMPIYEQDSLENLFLSYKGMGGNGTVDKLMEEMHNMPTQDGPTVPFPKKPNNHK